MTPDPSDLPELTEATLDRETLRTLLADIDASATEVEIIVRSRGRGAGVDAAPSIADAEAILLSDAAVPVQLRYRFEGDVYRDTLMPGAGGLRLVRCRERGRGR